ncbi:MAG: AraC family ligand binding domain-containing protein, partial [Pseudomonas sp.]|nr:AraC family ligand binding domain-containing protein [Pseudomonas sp.]
MSTPLREQAHLWQAPALGDVEMLHARYIQQRFAPHVHEGYVFTVIESGAQRFWHRGSEHLAPVGATCTPGTRASRSVTPLGCRR